MDFHSARGYLIDRLQRELNPLYTYHSVFHTLDVLDATNRLSISEGLDPVDIEILNTAALYHDAGMLLQYKDHEHASVSLAGQTLGRFGYSTEQIEQISDLIMVTKLPQLPVNQFEKIICDADLDYLGRDDFYIHSFQLKLEWELNGIRSYTLTEWYQSQIKFLSEHQYFTKSALQTRHDKKQDHLMEITRLLSSANITGTH